MAVNRIAYLALMLLILTSVYVAAYDSDNTTVRCQFGRPMRKQVPAEPLHGLCLQDIAVHVSTTLRSFGEEELGVPFLQDMINKMEFTQISGSLSAKLNSLVDKFNNKLKMYIDVLNQSYNAIYSVLSKTQDHSVYSSQMVDLNIIQDRVSDVCTRIITGTSYCQTSDIIIVSHMYRVIMIAALATNIRSQEWKNLHVLPVSQPSTICGPPTLAHNIGPLVLSQYCTEKNVILLLEHDTLMSETDFALTQMAAKTIIDMLSETDNITVVGLANTVPLYCRDGLLKATDINKFQLARYIDSLIRTGSQDRVIVVLLKSTYILHV